MLHLVQLQVAIFEAAHKPHMIHLVLLQAASHEAVQRANDILDAAAGCNA